MSAADRHAAIVVVVGRGHGHQQSRQTLVMVAIVSLRDRPVRNAHPPIGALREYSTACLATFS